MAQDDRKKAVGPSFYPEYLFEVLVVALLTVELVFVAALLFPPPVGRPIDLVGQYQPRPEWYFLWLYELIRYFPGRTVVVGAVLLPLGLLSLLGAVPFIDRYGNRFRRRYAVLVMALMALLAASMTLAGWSR